MKRRPITLLVVALATALLFPVVSAFAAPVETPELPPLPASPVPLPVTLPSELPALPPVNAPDPETVLAMLQGQIELIAAALQTTPDELLARVLGTEIPSVGSVVLTVNDLLNRLAGTKVFDANSNGIIGTTEIAVGNISHAFDVTFAKPAVTGQRCIDPATHGSACVAAPNPHVATLPAYSKVTSEWLPSTPAQSVLGTSILLPLINGLTPALPVAAPADVPITPVGADIPNQVCLTAPLPALCQNAAALIKANLILASTPGGRLVNIKGGGWELPDPAGGAPLKKGVHNGGTGLLTGSNLDTAFRTPTLLNDPAPVFLPLITSTSALVDNAVDFIGFSSSSASTSRTCTNVTGSSTTFSTGPDGVELAHFPAANCRARGSFSGFGLAVYGDHAPVDFRSDLALLWEEPPSAIAAVSDALATVLNTLVASAPSQTTVLTYALGLAGLVDLPALPDTGGIPPTDGGGLPALPIPLDALPPGLLPAGLPIGMLP